jgi:hypothetical protein
VAIGQTGRVSTSLIGLRCGDDPAAWVDLGFEVRGSTCDLGPVAIELDGTGGGVRGWVLGGDAGPQALDGIPTAWRDAAEPAPVEHPNGATGLDHVVVFTDSRDRTVEALVHAGGDLRRSGGPPQLPAPMAFVRMGEVIVEVAENGTADGAHLWGLVAVVPDVDALAAAHPDLLGSPRDAVQPGRRIVTARRRPGLDTALAFMTPR